ncbi:MAG: O-antigen ligase family protein [Flavobacteriales bacterium]
MTSLGTQTQWPQRLYEVALIVTALALPFSNWLMSQGAFLLVLAWLVDRYTGGPIFRHRTWSFWQNQPVLWGILALFCWQLLSQIWSEDLSYGWHSLRKQLPLLAFPLILITGRWDRDKGVNLVQHVIAISVILACIACLGLGLDQEFQVKPRDWSPFISHIRFSLLIAFTWGWWWYRWLTKKEVKSISILILLGIFGGWFIWKSASLTGVILAPLSTLVAFWQSNRFRFGIRIAAIFAAISLTAFVWMLRPVYPDSTQLKQATPSGELFENHPERCLRENGHHVWTHIAWNELSEGWSQRSNAAFEGQDGRNQELKMTLIRYMTSKGLKKDLNGMGQLSDEDIKQIESGIPTILEKEHHGLTRRLDAIQFEVWNALDGGNPSGHSLIQRGIFFYTGLYIYQQHPVFGVGVGDVQGAFEKAYEELDSPLEDAFRLRAHNQFLTFLIAGGPLNLVLWITLLIVMVYRRSLPPEDRSLQHFARLFVFILVLSCITEDTLETQAGVTFAGFFIGLFGKRSVQQGQ